MENIQKQCSENTGIVTFVVEHEGSNLIYYMSNVHA